MASGCELALVGPTTPSLCAAATRRGRGVGRRERAGTGRVCSDTKLAVEERERGLVTNKLDLSLTARQIPR